MSGDGCDHLMLWMTRLIADELPSIPSNVILAVAIAARQRWGEMPPPTSRGARARISIAQSTESGTG
jgi:hypothetical protein